MADNPDEAIDNKKLRWYVVVSAGLAIALMLITMGVEERSWPLAAFGVGLFAFSIGVMLGWRLRGQINNTARAHADKHRTGTRPNEKFPRPRLQNR